MQKMLNYENNAKNHRDTLTLDWCHGNAFDNIKTNHGRQDVHDPTAHTDTICSHIHVYTTDILINTLARGCLPGKNTNLITDYGRKVKVVSRSRI